MKLKIILTAVATLMFTFRVNGDDFRVIDFGHYSLRNVTPWMKVITNQTDWEIFYNELLSDNGLNPIDDCSPDSPSSTECSSIPPQVDFSQYQVVTGGVGVKHHPSNRLVIESVSSSDPDEILVKVLDIGPYAQSGCLVNTVYGFVFPMTTVVVPKVDGKSVRVDVEQAGLICEDVGIRY